MCVGSPPQPVGDAQTESEVITSAAESSFGDSPGSLLRLRTDTANYLSPDRELTTDLECPSMLRTVTARTVLRGFGRVFRTEGIDSAYSLSQECERLGYFISHSWSAPWFTKFVTLAFHFNFWFATIISLLFITVFLTLSLIFMSHEIWDSIRESINPSLIFVSIGFLTFLPSFLFGSELMWCMPLGNSNRTRCFLDKCCINQTDPVLKRRGIEALGVFLAKSDVMLILWSPDYFMRLWCAYEVAVYMSLDSNDVSHHRHRRRVIMIPLELVSFAMLVFGLDLLIQIVSVNFFFQETNGLPEWATQLTATAIAALFAAFAYFFSYRWQKDQAFLRKQLAEFRLSQVECSDPSDRPLVLRDIAKRYATTPPKTEPTTNKTGVIRSTSSVIPDDTPTREPSPLPSRDVSATGLPNAVGLRNFEDYVRSNLQKPIDKALGAHHWILPYKFSFAMSLPAVWAALGLTCHWILKAKGMGDTEDVLDSDSVAFLIASKLLRSITFYPLLTAALLLYQDVTEKYIKGRTWAQVVRGIIAVLLIGVYFYMFGFHYIFLRQMDPDIVFFTTLPQVLLFLLIYTRLGTFVYKWATGLRERCKSPRGTILPRQNKSSAATTPQTLNGDMNEDVDREETRSRDSNEVQLSSLPI
jgi:hypothetical protein